MGHTDEGQDTGDEMDLALPQFIGLQFNTDKLLRKNPYTYALFSKLFPIQTCFISRLEL